MREVDYVGAVRRNWLLIVVLVVVGGIVGLVVPVHTHHSANPLTAPLAPTYQATVVLGQSSATSASTVNPVSVLAALHSPSVEDATATAVGLPTADARAIAAATTLGGTSLGGYAEGNLGVTAATPALAVDLANTEATEIINTLTAQAIAARNQQILNSQHQVTSLETQITNLDTTIKADEAAKSTADVTVLQAQANALATTYGTDYSNYETLLSDPAPTSGLVVVTPATVATQVQKTAKTSLVDRRAFRGPAGAAGGLIVGVLIALLLAQIDRRLRNRSSTEAAFGYQVLVEVPRQRITRSQRDIAVRVASHSPAAEAYRTLRSALLSRPILAHQHGPVPARTPANGSNGSNGSADAERADPTTAELAVVEVLHGGETSGVAQGTDAAGEGSASFPHPSGTAEVETPTGDVAWRPVLAIVSPGAEPTRQVVVANLAAAAAENGLSVLVLSTADGTSAKDSSKDAVQASAAANGQGGAAAGGWRSLSEVARPTALAGVRTARLSALRPSMPGFPDEDLSAVISEARLLADAVIIDGGGVLTQHDAANLAASVDLMAIVAQTGWTTLDQAERSASLLGYLNAPVEGVVLTQVRLPSRRRARTRRSVLDYDGVVSKNGAL